MGKMLFSAKSQSEKIFLEEKLNAFKEQSLVEKTTLEKLYNVQERNDTDIAICGFNIIDINTNQLIHEGLNNKFKEVEEINGKNENFAYLNLDGGNKLIKKDYICSRIHKNKLKIARTASV